MKLFSIKKDNKSFLFNELGVELLEKNKEIDSVNKSIGSVERLSKEKELELHTKEKILEGKAALLYKIEQALNSVK